MQSIRAVNSFKHVFSSLCLQIYQPRYVLPPQVSGQLPQMSSHYPGTQVFMPMQPHMSVGPVGQNVPMAYYPMGAMYPPGSTVMVEGGFDAGARFTAGSSVSIPVSIHIIQWFLKEQESLQLWCCAVMSVKSKVDQISTNVCASPAPTSWTSPQCSSAGCHAECQCCNDTAQE